jgi:hypothetical protein
VLEADTPTGERSVTLASTSGHITPDLTLDDGNEGTQPLLANRGIAFTGMYPLGQGFVLSPAQVEAAIGDQRAEREFIRSFFTARDLTRINRHSMVIDFWPRTMEESRGLAPHLFQWVLERVKPQRDQDKIEERRRNWWLFTRPIPDLRRAVAELHRYLLVPRTAKHFTFQFQSPRSIPDTSVVAIATSDAYVLGVLSSRLHRAWALARGGTLEDRPRYQHLTTFVPFPFPACSDELTARIRAVGESLDAHRKRQQALHPDLTITGMYNVLTRLRSGEVLTAKEKVIHEQGLVSVLKQIHNDLDAAVFDAYGWPHDLTGEQILERLVALNRERAEEEKKGLVRWLRPEFQAPKGAAPATQPSSPERRKPERSKRRPQPPRSRGRRRSPRKSPPFATSSAAPAAPFASTTSPAPSRARRRRTSKPSSTA